MLIPYRYHHIVYIFWVIVVIVLLVIAGVILAQKTPQKSDYSLSVAFLEGISPHYTPHIETYGSLIEGKITPEEATLIDCVWKGESTRGKKMFGDYKNGVPMAYGHFQIWLSEHPVTYECAMDFDCSSSYFLKKVREGQGELWTTYKNCKGS